MESLAMFDITPMLTAGSGSLLLFVLPMVIAIGVGLVWVGLVKRRYLVAILGVALPVATGMIGSSMSQAAISHPELSSGNQAILTNVESMQPIAWMLGAALFLIAILPACLRVSFGGRK